MLRLSSSGLPTPRCDVREGKEAASDDPHPIPASEAHALLDSVEEGSGRIFKCVRLEPCDALVSKKSMFRGAPF